ncbi:MAG: hypothetical protein QOF83_4267 [Solirubrobacteraceae bacterium]|nr:hypothetical protein [Solirubrobacteraceae bacterium]
MTVDEAPHSPMVSEEHRHLDSPVLVAGLRAWAADEIKQAQPRLAWPGWLTAPQSIYVEASHED